MGLRPLQAEPTLQHTTLYVPFNASTRGPWILRRNAELVGQYPTREDALRHAVSLTAALRAQSGQQVDIKIEDESGRWQAAEVEGAGPV
ncbi:hypothetical protein SAMN05660880_00146 [Luteibacter sp. 22Crub2.1]|nr:hypothetical protein SAMN04515659_1006 [Dyella sp. 333MFSha]SKB26413.1 hypothetical protein SAMN05660880_00146 [Luteibacter sp. 22Crub2.1]